MHNIYHRIVPVSYADLVPNLESAFARKEDRAQDYEVLRGACCGKERNVPNLTP